MPELLTGIRVCTSEPVKQENGKISENIEVARGESPVKTDPSVTEAIYEHENLPVSP